MICMQALHKVYIGGGKELDPLVWTSAAHGSSYPVCPTPAGRLQEINESPDDQLRQSESKVF